LFIRHKFLGLAFAAGVAVMPLCAAAAEITVFAAASLKNALDQIAQSYQTKTGDSLAISYASSGKLATQIQAGAPADLFISAAANWMDTLADSGDIRPDSRIDLLSNDLVLVGAVGAEPVEDKPWALGQRRAQGGPNR
jgi:molybdate transport system substrate-binding protein